MGQRLPQLQSAEVGRGARVSIRHLGNYDALVHRG
jgi:hypothetical protein